jgi:hypothetical protein
MTAFDGSELDDLAAGRGGEADWLETGRSVQELRDRAESLRLESYDGCPCGHCTMKRHQLAGVLIELADMEREPEEDGDLCPHCTMYGPQLDPAEYGAGARPSRAPGCVCLPEHPGCLARYALQALILAVPPLPVPPMGCEIVSRYCAVHELLTMQVRPLPLPLLDPAPFDATE